MLRTTSPNISIITNFGCHAACWYCIWKGHPLENVRLDTDWNKLYQFLSDNRDKGKVSVSGGGDCLYRYDKYVDWWIKLFEITKELGLLVDVHTREKFSHSRFWKRINKCVFSSDKLDNDKEFLDYLNFHTKVRITHLVTADTSDETIEEYIQYQKNTNCQFTIKELVGFDDKGRYKQIRIKYPEIYNLDAGDYNIYYFPNNIIGIKFLI